MRCLNDSELQAVVDDEASAEIQAHATSCDRCRPLVEARRLDMAALASAIAPAMGVPPVLDARVRRQLSEDRPTRGATALRMAPPRSWRPSGWVTVGLTTATVAVVVFLVLPRLGAPTTLSASEVLGRSLQTLTSNTGVEHLEYDLFVDGEMPGPQRVEQLIDHDHAGRFRISIFGADGTLDTAIAQDAASRHRVHLFRVDGRNYLINLTWSGEPRLSLPEIGQALLETTVTMMQATSDQRLTTLDRPEGREYIVELPQVAKAGTTAVIDLHQARAVIDEHDFRIEEFDASGVVLKQPFRLSYKLIRRSVRPSADVPPAEFDIPAGPGDVVLSGEADRDPVAAVTGTVLRELGRLENR